MKHHLLQILCVLPVAVALTTLFLVLYRKYLEKGD